MEIKAIAKSVRISTRKISLVADMVRHLSIADALATLEAKHKRAALPLAKLLKSAVANAVNNSGLDKNNLVIESINVSGGPALKRFWPSTRGRIHPYKKRSTNIRIVLKEKIKASPKKVEDKKDLPRQSEAKAGVKKNEKENKKGDK